MIESVASFLETLGRNFHLVDLLDITLVALVLFAILTGIMQSTSQSASRRIIVTISLFLLLYLLASLFELYLFERLMQMLLVVLVLAAVIVFQSDIRRMVDWIATQAFHRQPGAGFAQTPVDILTEACAKMAETKTGALIAIRGREPWDHEIQGGIELRGIVSQPLLYSIFNPQTPGHDGVVLMEGNKVIKFAAHLPLSTNLPEASKYGGTRHAAALGLAEECDALVIVVSEERGAISVANAAKLSEVSSPSELKRRLEQFYEDHYGDPERGRPSLLRRRAIQTAAVSLLLAAMLWIRFAYSPGAMLRYYEAPVEFRNLPENWALDDPVPSEVRVGIVGSEQDFRVLDAASLVASVDMEAPQEGRNEYAITANNIKLPDGLRLDSVEPNEVHVDAELLRAVRMRVEVRTRGALSDTLRLVAIEADPDTITLLLPRRQANPPASVMTERVNLEEVTGSARLRSTLVLPSGARLPAETSPEVTVDVKVRSATSAN